MEELYEVLNLLKKYKEWYFLKRYIFSGKLATILTIFYLVATLAMSLSFFYFHIENYLLPSWALLLIFCLFLYDRWLKSLYKQFYRHCLGVKYFFSGYNLSLKIQRVGEELYETGKLNTRFLDKVEKQCDTFLILEKNGFSFNLHSNLFGYFILAVLVAIASHLVTPLSMKTLASLISILLSMLVFVWLFLEVFNAKYVNVRLVKVMVGVLRDLEENKTFFYYCNKTHES